MQLFNDAYPGTPFPSMRPPTVIPITMPEPRIPTAVAHQAGLAPPRHSFCDGPSHEHGWAVAPYIALTAAGALVAGGMITLMRMRAHRECADAEPTVTRCSPTSPKHAPAPPPSSRRFMPAPAAARTPRDDDEFHDVGAWHEAASPISPVPVADPTVAMFAPEPTPREAELDEWCETRTQAPLGGESRWLMV
jgi:hypothetical protein